MIPTGLLLAINGGSSSIKFSIFESDNKLQQVLTGKIYGIGSDKVIFEIQNEKKTKIMSKMIGSADYNSAVNIFMDWLKEFSKDKKIIAIGHRIVYGGPRYSSPQQVTNDICNELHRLSTLYPDHLPKQIFLLESIGDIFVHQLQIACFDTFFHKDMPKVAQLFPIPRRYFDQGIRRYGFHGLSCEYLMGALAKLDGSYVANGRVILAHLGNGASITAVHNGKCVDTSMSLTSCSGLPMATRSGDLDPGLLFYLAQHDGMNPTQINNMMNHESGLKGISGTSGNIENLLKHETTDQYAAESVNFFCYQIKKWICLMAGTMGGINTLIFSGGVGENIPEIRSRICEKLEFIGVFIEHEENLFGNNIISTSTSPVLVRVVKTNEELVIAQHLFAVINERKFGNCEL